VNTLDAFEEAKKSNPYLAPLLDLEQDILIAMGETREKLPPVSGRKVSSKKVKEKVNQGKSLIDPSDLAVDESIFAELREKIGQILIKHRPDLKAKADDEGSEVADFITQNALRPFLEKEAAALLPKIDQTLWLRPYCPICGGKPDFAILERDVGARHLICSRCNTQWLYKRLECPFCGTEDVSNLSYYASEDKVYRLYICEACKHYLKAIDLRETGKDPVIPVERVVTLDMDIAAQEKGYLPPLQ
jgi:FdhE protein